MDPAQKRPPSSDVAILERLLRPVDGKLSSAAAQSLLGLGFEPEDLARMHELAQRAQAGELTAEEREEASAYERVGHLLGLLRSKARRALQTARPWDGARPGRAGAGARRRSL